jgi:hypothetical protein
MYGIHVSSLAERLKSKSRAMVNLEGSRVWEPLNTLCLLLPFTNLALSGVTRNGTFEEGTSHIHLSDFLVTRPTTHNAPSLVSFVSIPNLLLARIL